MNKIIMGAVTINITDEIISSGNTTNIINIGINAAK